MKEADAVVQTSSGSSGREPRQVRRSLDDIASIHAIVLSTWLELFDSPPQREALLGGISHGQAASKFRVAGTTFESFGLEERDRLNAYNPHFLSCYPSLVREIVSDPGFALPALRAIKLGGERIFVSDLRKIQTRFPGVPVIEQLGCTERPALAMGVYRQPSDPRRLKLQKHRFTFQKETHEDWQRLVVRDDFPGAAACFPGFYDTGDEVRYEGDFIVDIRRRDAAASHYHAEAERLLALGCTNVQFDLITGELAYLGGPDLPLALLVAGRNWRPVRRAPHRLPRSNKLPLTKST